MFNNIALQKEGKVLKVDHKQNKKGFTLSEVLITLGIIGVVAAITIPTLIANTRSQQYRIKFKKTVSVLSQAAKMSNAQYDFDYAGINAQCSSKAAKDHPDNRHSICALINGTLTGLTYYDNVTDIKMNVKSTFGNYSANYGPYLSSQGAFNIANFRAYMLNDGTIIAIHKGLSTNCSLGIDETMKDYTGEYIGATTLDKCLGFIDVNGPTLPNKEVSCSSGSNSLKKHDCIVKNDAQHMTDIYPIRFHDQIVEPASAAARYVLKSAK